MNRMHSPSGVGPRTNMCIDHDSCSYRRCVLHNPVHFMQRNHNIPYVGRLWDAVASYQVVEMGLFPITGETWSESE
jgi:hypothetical protein